MRLIDADALIIATQNFCDGYEVRWTDKKVMAWINGYATIDAVPVVRCQDCIHYKEKDLFGHIAHECEEYETDTGADGYCHKGVRRERGE